MAEVINHKDYKGIRNIYSLYFKCVYTRGVFKYDLQRLLPSTSQNICKKIGKYKYKMPF